MVPTLIVNSGQNGEQGSHSCVTEEAGCRDCDVASAPGRNDKNGNFRNLDEFPNDLSMCNFPDKSSFEKDFCMIVVQRGLGRTVVNDFLQLFRKYNVGNFPKDARSILGSLRVVETCDVSPGRYHHFGLSEALNQAVKYVFPQDARSVQLQVNIDGLPLTKSSHSSFWPILGKCVSPIVSRVFVIGLYFGNTKPASVQDFLSPFIKECVDAQNNGLFIGGVKCDFEVHSVVCDAPARQYVKCIKPHTGYFSCERCTITGVYIEKKGVRFSETFCPARSNESFRERLQESHHVGLEDSPFCTLELDMIAMFPLDYMHLVLLGVVRRNLKSWLGLKGGDGITFAKLHRLHIQTINCRQLMFSKSVPSEFQRKPRSFSFATLFKATELRMFLCYTSPAIMLRMFKKVYIYQHFMLLVCAMRVLLSPAQSDESVTFARTCLESFVRFAPRIYGKSCHVYNVHNLVHLADDYKRFGPLDGISGFPFESFLFFLKSYVKRPGKELEQVVKRLHEENNMLQGETLKKSVTLSGEHFNGPLGKYDGEADVIQFTEVMYHGQSFRLNSENSTVFWNNRFAKIVNILQVKCQIVLLIRVYTRNRNVFRYPCDSTCMGIAFVEKSTAPDLVNVHISEVQKCWLTDWNSNYYYVVKLLHGHT